MNKLSTHIREIRIDTTPRFVARRPIAIRLTEVAAVASTLAEVVTPAELNGIRLLCKAFEIEVTK